jgi:hypothetical protein
VIPVVITYKIGDRVRICFRDVIYYAHVERIERQVGVQMLWVRTENFGQLVPMGSDRKEIEKA